LHLREAGWFHGPAQEEMSEGAISIFKFAPARPSVIRIREFEQVYRAGTVQKKKRPLRVL
jgi:hypothetical protein